MRKSTEIKRLRHPLDPQQTKSLQLLSLAEAIIDRLTSYAIPNSH